MNEFNDYTGEKMDPEVKVQWLAALRSGNFMQATGELKCDHGSCCLGVLAEINGDLVPSDKVIFSPGAHKFHNLAHPGSSSHNMVPVGYCGLTSEAIDVLWPMNDNQGKSFTQIADWIEENL